MIPQFRAHIPKLDKVVDVLSITWYKPDLVVLRWKEGKQERYYINDFELFADVLQDSEPVDIGDIGDVGDIDEEW